MKRRELLSKLEKKKLAIGDGTGDCTGFVVFMLSVIRESLQALNG
jgi:hypothetical protein